MLRGNLATRPFYNERAVHLALAVIALVAVAATVFNVSRLVALSRRHTELSAEADRQEVAAGAIARQAAAIRQGINDQELKTVAAAAREANAIIDRRMFSWTEFFNRIESTLPQDVRLTTVRPDVNADGLVVSMVVVGRTVEEIDAFIEQLEATGAFVDLLASQEESTDDDMYRATLRGRYVASSGGAAGGESSRQAARSLE